MFNKKTLGFAALGLVVLCVAALVIGLLFSSSDETATEQPTDQQQSTDQQPAEQSTTEAPAEVQPAAVGIVDTGFRPEVNGFSYQNYGDVGQSPNGETFPVVNLTSIEMRRMFGDGVCAGAPKDDNTCTLTPPAGQWMEQNNSSMSGGHCEGFAVLSQMIYGGQLDANQFGAARTIDLQLANNEPLQRELAYWWATQGPTWNTQQTLAPNDAITYLQTEYTNDPKNLFRLGIMKQDQTGGHAITAYAVQDQGAGIYWIMVYDNNYPGDERHMVVNTNENTWEYEASINPSVEPDLYSGDASNPILIAANQPRLETFPCDFCSTTSTSSKGGNFMAAAALEYNEIWTEGYINVELEDDKGRKIGYDEKGAFVNEIPEAKLTPILSGTLSEVPPVIDMPAGLAFTAYIYGDQRAADEPASVVMIGRGYYVGIDGLSMAPDQLDMLSFDGEGDFLTYTTDAQESPDIIVGIEKPDADFELVLKAVEVSKGTDIHVLFDQKEDTFAFQTTSDAVAQFTVSITRIDANGDEETFDSGDTLIEVEPDKLMYFYFGDWKGQGSNLEIGYDENGNGTIEDSEVSNMADAG